MALLPSAAEMAEALSRIADLEARLLVAEAVAAGGPRGGPSEGAERAQVFFRWAAPIMLRGTRSTPPAR